MEHPNPSQIISRLSDELKCIDLDKGIIKPNESKNKESDNMDYEKFLKVIEDMGYTVEVDCENIMVMANQSVLAIISIVKPYKYEVFEDKLESICYQLAVVKLEDRGMIS